MGEESEGEKGRRGRKRERKIMGEESIGIKRMRYIGQATFGIYIFGSSEIQIIGGRADTRRWSEIGPIARGTRWSKICFGTRFRGDVIIKSRLVHKSGQSA